MWLFTPTTSLCGASESLRGLRQTPPGSKERSPLRHPALLASLSLPHLQPLHAHLKAREKEFVQQVLRSPQRREKCSVSNRRHQFMERHLDDGDTWSGLGNACQWAKTYSYPTKAQTSYLRNGSGVAPFRISSSHINPAVELGHMPNPRAMVKFALS